jgi:CubicO group peptidase (beta-lactamase class C family)
MNADCDFSAALRLDLARWVDDGAGPGVIAAVLSGGQIRSWASRGRAGLGPDAATLTPKTVFYVASVSKQFTAACVACCEAAGRLEVGASVRRYLPELPAAFEPVALEHLLHHLGGLPDDQALRAAAGLSGEIWEGCGLWDLVALLAAAPQLVRAPGCSPPAWSAPASASPLSPASSCSSRWGWATAASATIPTRRSRGWR